MKTTFNNIPKEKQNRILSEAMKEFAAYGYEVSSTNRLVKTLGISKGSLFKYFENKLDLYKDLLTIAIDELLKYMAHFTPTNHSPKDNLLEYAELEFDFLIAYPTIYRFFYKVQQDLNHPDLFLIKEQVITIAMDINKQLYDVTGIPDNPILRQHLILLISGYNRAFMESIDEPEDFTDLKEPFIEGLRLHLDLVKWP